MSQVMQNPMTTRQAACRLGVSVRTVHRLAARGGLNATRVAGTFAFNPAEVEALATERGR